MKLKLPGTKEEFTAWMLAHSGADFYDTLYGLLAWTRSSNSTRNKLVWSTIMRWAWENQAWLIQAQLISDDHWGHDCVLRCDPVICETGKLYVDWRDLRGDDD